MACEMRHQRAGAPFGARRQHQRGDVAMLLDIFADDVRRRAGTNGDGGHLAHFAENISGCAVGHDLGAFARFLFDGRLDPAECIEGLLRDKGEDVDRTVGFLRPQRCKAQGLLRFVRFIHHD